MGLATSRLAVSNVYNTSNLGELAALPYEQLQLVMFKYLVHYIPQNGI